MINAAASNPTINRSAPLPLTDRVDGPWLAIREGTRAESASIVLAGDPRAPTIWRSIDAAVAPVVLGRIEHARLIPLADFGVCCTLYSRSHQLSVWCVGRSHARRAAGAPWPWVGLRVERLNVQRDPFALELLRDAVRECNASARVRA